MRMGVASRQVCSATVLSTVSTGPMNGDARTVRVKPDWRKAYIFHLCVAYGLFFKASQCCVLASFLSTGSAAAVEALFVCCLVFAACPTVTVCLV